jgi:hypothetical protein
MTTISQSPIVEDEDSENSFPPNGPACCEAQTNSSPRQHPASPISYSEGFWELPEFALEKENNAPKTLGPKHAQITSRSLHYSVRELHSGKRKWPRFYHRKRTKDRETQKAFRQRTQEHIARLERRIKELSGEGLSDDLDSDSALAEEQRKTLKLEEELSQLRQMLAVKEGTSEFHPAPDQIPVTSTATKLFPAASVSTIPIAAAPGGTQHFPPQADDSDSLDLSTIGDILLGLSTN